MTGTPSPAPASTPSRPLRVAVAGASGRMGRMLIEALRASDDCVLAGALDVPSSPGIGSDATAFLGHASGVAITADIAAGLRRGLGVRAARGQRFRSPQAGWRQRPAAIPRWEALHGRAR